MTRRGVRMTIAAVTTLLVAGLAGAVPTSAARRADSATGR